MIDVEEDGEPGILCPWHREEWSKTLGRFKTIETFLLITPTYVVWPPDSKSAQKAVLNAWTPRVSSALKTIGILCGLDDGERLEGTTYETPHSPGISSGVSYGFDLDNGQWEISYICIEEEPWCGFEGDNF
jgi:hypothetical protein